MNGYYLPPEILEKIIIEGNYFNVSRVNQKWRELSQKHKSKFKDIFDLNKDDPEKINKEFNTIFIYNSQHYKNRYVDIKDVFYSFFISKYNVIIYQKFENILKNLSFLNKLNIIFNPLLFVNSEDLPQDFLSKNNFDKKIFGLIIEIRFFLSLIKYLKLSNIKIKIINIGIKDCYNKIKNINANIFLENEIETLSRLIKYQLFKFFEKFTFNAPNNTYLIYDENKKILIIRFGHYEKYNLILEKINICKKIDDQIYRVRKYSKKECDKKYQDLLAKDLTDEKSKNISSQDLKEIVEKNLSQPTKAEIDSNQSIIINNSDLENVKSNQTNIDSNLINNSDLQIIKDMVINQQQDLKNIYKLSKEQEEDLIQCSQLELCEDFLEINSCEVKVFENFFKN